MYTSLLNLLSACGYSEQARRDREKIKQTAAFKASSQFKTGAQQVTYDFTGCLAHVEITERVSDGTITRIAGHLGHNDKCTNSVLKHLPAVPLHEHVYEVALEQLESGANFVIY